TSPNTNSLLAGLGAAPRKPPSKRDRESDPEIARGVAVTPRAGQVVIRPGAGASSPAEEGAPTTPRAFPVRPVVRTAATLDAPPNPGDTFSSQATDARRAIPRARTGLLLVGAFLLTGKSPVRARGMARR